MSPAGFDHIWCRITRRNVARLDLQVIRYLLTLHWLRRFSSGEQQRFRCVRTSGVKLTILKIHMNHWQNRFKLWCIMYLGTEWEWHVGDFCGFESMMQRTSNHYCICNPFVFVPFFNLYNLEKVLAPFATLTILHYPVPDSPDCPFPLGCLASHVPRSGVHGQSFAHSPLLLLHLMLPIPGMLLSPCLPGSQASSSLLNDKTGQSKI